MRLVRIELPAGPPSGEDMAFRIEIVCDLSIDKGYHGDCYSACNRNFRLLTDNTDKDILITMKTLRENARKQGWIQTHKGWKCPYCKEHR